MLYLCYLHCGGFTLLMSTCAILRHDIGAGSISTRRDGWGWPVESEQGGGGFSFCLLITLICQCYCCIAMRGIVPMSTYSQNTAVMSIKCVRMCACNADSCSNKISLRHVPVLNRGKKKHSWWVWIFLVRLQKKANKFTVPTTREFIKIFKMAVF